MSWSPNKQVVFRSLQASTSNKPRRVRDVLYGGLIELTPLLWQIVDTPEFQRLRGLKQLGLTEYVYPSATHTRFAHSLGTCYLAMQLLRTLASQGKINAGPGTPKVDERTSELVAAAALCHDLGHGPFSHIWDDLISPGVHHEQRSIDLFERLVKDNGIPLSSSEIAFVQSLILPDSSKPEIVAEKKRRESRSIGHSFLYDIVANYECSVDVDKMDYISRDVFYTGAGSLGILNYQRIFDDMMICNGRLVFNKKLKMSLIELFRKRYQLHKIVYQHKTAVAFDHVLAKIFKEAEPVFGYKEKALDMDTFVTMTDDILMEIVRFQGTQEQEKQLKRCRELIRKLQLRRHPKCCFSVDALPRKLSNEELTDLKTQVENAVSDKFLEFSSDKVTYVLGRYGFGKVKDDQGSYCSPIEKVWFYNPKTKECERLKHRDISPLESGAYYECYLYIYVWEEKLRKPIAQAAQRWAEKTLQRILHMHHANAKFEELKESLAILSEKNPELSKKMAEKIQSYADDVNVKKRKLDQPHTLRKRAKES